MTGSRFKIRHTFVYDTGNTNGVRMPRIEVQEERGK